ncbi:hypothetical protein TorRG33x02_307030 [Trema orientale]|uniref:Uncharacterized protein n=1 Tax=Trema orientale TaxID=63057 RepID=A0A2P5BVQ0_TREOI|nr:hypothetical protein TorRG33x02_307030 [Trema orientale]
MTRSSISFNFVTKNCGLPLVDLVSLGGDELASELSWILEKNILQTKPLSLKDDLNKHVISFLSFISFLSSLRRRQSDLLQKRKFLEKETLSGMKIENDEPPPKLESSKFLDLSLRADEGKVGNQIQS